MTIGQLAAAAGVRVSTVRYYERVGLLGRPARTASGYRVYDDDALLRLRFIRAAQAVGFALDDIRMLLDLDRQSACDDVQRILRGRIADVDRRLVEMQSLRSTLADALRRCRRSRRGCPVLADLKSPRRRGGRSGPRGKSRTRA